MEDAGRSLKEIKIHGGLRVRLKSQRKNKKLQEETVKYFARVKIS